MTLSFKQKFDNGYNTRFPQKIWATIERYKLASQQERKEWSIKVWADGELTFLSSQNDAPKIHTIRVDQGKRWKAGTTIHPVINNRRPNRYQFAPCFPCVSTQEIRIEWMDKFPSVKIDGKDFYKLDMRDAKLIDWGIEQLARNDGFDTIHEFFEYFNKDFLGVLIHFTNFRYFGNTMEYTYIKNAAAGRVGWEMHGLKIVEDEDGAYAVVDKNYDRAVVGPGDTLHFTPKGLRVK